MLGLLAAPLVAEAQPGKAFRVGFLTAFSSNADAHLFDSFRQGMRELGYEEGGISRTRHDGRKADLSVFPVWPRSWLRSSWTSCSRPARQRCWPRKRPPGPFPS